MNLSPQWNHRNNKAPRNDFITNKDIKRLLHEEYENFDSFEFSDVVLKILFNLLTRFFELEKIPG